jgi:hypothetical protein
MPLLKLQPAAVCVRLRPAVAALLSFIASACGSEVVVTTPNPSTSAGSSASAGGGGAIPPTPCEDGVGPWEHEEEIAAPTRELSNLVQDADGQLHAFTPGAYIRGRAGAWTVEPLPYSSTCSQPSLAIDHAGHAHVACGMYHWAYITEYWTNSSGQWLKTHLHPADDGGGPASLALAPDGTPHAIYLNYPTGQYVHATATSEGWTRQLLPASPANEDRAVIAFGPAGQLWLAFMRRSTGGTQTLALGRIDPAGNYDRIDLEQHEHAAFVGGLAFDEEGVAHITYSGEYTNVYYGQLKDDHWTGLWLNNGSPLSGQHVLPMLALATTGQPSLALTRSNDDSAIYLRATRFAETDPLWEQQQIGASRREVASLAVDELGAAHVLSIERSDDQEDRLLYNTNRRRCR